MDSENLKNSSNPLYCKCCDYLAKRPGDFKKHLLTKKHHDNMMIKNGKHKGNKMVIKHHICGCGKSYLHASGLSRHKKTCSFQKEETSVALTNASSDKDNQILQLVDTIKELLPHLASSTNIHNNSNSNNNNSNNNNRISANQINVFLNEKCADAMSIQDFAKQLAFTVDDLLLQKQESLIKVINQNLQPLKLTERPVHCSNISKRKWHVKDKEDGWKADNGHHMLTEVEHNIIKHWAGHFDKAFPGWQLNPTKKDEFVKIVGSTTRSLEPKAEARVLTHLGENLFIGKIEMLE